MSGIYIFFWDGGTRAKKKHQLGNAIIKKKNEYASARNPFFRLSLKRSLGSGLFSIALEIRQNGDKSTIGAGFTTQLSKLRKRHILNSLPHEGAL